MSAAVAAAALAAFNLVCTMQDGGPARAFSSDRTVVYRIDLSLGRACDGDCRTLRALVGASETEIVFLDAYFHLPNMKYDIRVDRRDGRYTMTMSATTGSPSWIQHVGTCRQEPFSGFPRRARARVTPVEVPLPRPLPPRR